MTQCVDYDPELVRSSQRFVRRTGRGGRCAGVTAVGASTGWCRWPEDLLAWTLEDCSALPSRRVAARVRRRRRVGVRRRLPRRCSRGWRPAKRPDNPAACSGRWHQPRRPSLSVSRPLPTPSRCGGTSWPSTSGSSRRRRTPQPRSRGAGRRAVERAAVEPVRRRVIHRPRPQRGADLLGRLFAVGSLGGGREGDDDPGRERRGRGGLGADASGNLPHSACGTGAARRQRG